MYDRCVSPFRRARAAAHIARPRGPVVRVKYNYKGEGRRGVVGAGAAVQGPGKAESRAGGGAKFLHSSCVERASPKNIYCTDLSTTFLTLV